MTTRWALVAMLSIVSAAAHAQEPDETLFYGAEWRFVRAGEAQVKWTGLSQAELQLRTAGIVASLYKVNDVYRSNYGANLCLQGFQSEAHEGRRNREARATFDAAKRRASFLEKDMSTGATTASKEIEIPACVFDVVGGLRRLRQMLPQPGSVTELPVSDGKKVVMARIEAQQKEQVRTPLGEFPAVRYEVFLFNGVLYARKGRLFVWISDSDKRLPVQIKVQLPFYVGTITLQLEKVQ